MATVTETSFAARRGNITLANIAQILTVIGGINWGLVGLFNFDLVAAIFGNMSGFTRFIYVIVGIAALISLMNLRRRSRVSSEVR